MTRNISHGECFYIMVGLGPSFLKIFKVRIKIVTPLLLVQCLVLI